MSVLTIVVAILLPSLRFRVNCDVRNDNVANYFSSLVPRDSRNPIFDGVSSGDLENNENDKKDLIIEEIKNEYLPQFSNLNLSEQLKSVLLNDYYLTRPYTRGDVSNLYNLDLLGSGLIDFNTRKNNNLWQSRPNYNWLNRNMTWPIIWHRQYPRSNSFPNSNSSGYNLCNNHMRHLDGKGSDSVMTQPSMNTQKIAGIKTENSKMLNNGLLESKELLHKSKKDFSEPIGNKFDIGPLNLANSTITALDADSINKLKNLTSNIVQHLPSLSDIYIRQSENDLTKLFNSFNTSSLLNKYENSNKQDIQQ